MARWPTVRGCCFTKQYSKIQLHLKGKICQFFLSRVCQYYRGICWWAVQTNDDDRVSLELSMKISHIASCLERAGTLWLSGTWTAATKQVYFLPPPPPPPAEEGWRMLVPPTSPCFTAQRVSSHVSSGDFTKNSQTRGWHDILKSGLPGHNLCSVKFSLVRYSVWPVLTNYQLYNLCYSQSGCEHVLLSGVTSRLTCPSRSKPQTAGPGSLSTQPSPALRAILALPGALSCHGILCSSLGICLALKWEGRVGMNERGPWKTLSRWEFWWLLLRLPASDTETWEVVATGLRFCLISSNKTMLPYWCPGVLETSRTWR